MARAHVGQRQILALRQIRHDVTNPSGFALQWSVWRRCAAKHASSSNSRNSEIRSVHSSNTARELVYSRISSRSSFFSDRNTIYEIPQTDRNESRSDNLESSTLFSHFREKRVEDSKLSL